MLDYLLLTFGSLLAFILILLDARRRYGVKETLFFVLAAFTYGVVRHTLIWWVTIRSTQTLFPYQFIQTPFTILTISPQELVGWAIASYLGWHVGGIFLGESNIFRQFLGTFLFISSLSLAIETTAIESHWWFWNVTLVETPFGKAPIIGLIDWGFVGVEFAAPYFLWRKTKKLPYLLFILFFTPIHFCSHLFFHPLEKILRSPMELFHYVLLTCLLILALFLRSKANGIERSGQKYVTTATLTVVGVLLIVQVVHLKTLQLLPFLAPILWILFESIAPGKSVFSILQLPLGFLSRIFIPGAIPGTLQLVFKSTSRAVKLAVVLILIFGFIGWTWNIKVREEAYVEVFKEANKAYNQGQLEDAERLLKKALTISNLHFDTYYYLGTILRKQGKWLESIEAYKIMLTKKEFDKEGSKWLITAYLMTDQADKAQETVEDLLTLYPEEHILLYLAGNVEHQLNHSEEAQKYWNAFLNFSGEGKDPIMVGQAHLNLNQPQKGIIWAKEYLQKNPSDWELAQWLETVYLDREEADNVFQLYSSLAEAYPRRSYILKVGRYGAKAGHLEEAKRAYASILRNEPDNLEAKAFMEQLKQKTR